MRKILLTSMLALNIALAGGTTQPSTDPSSSTRSATILYTTDVHGHFFPYDFIASRPASGSISRAASAVDSIRRALGSDHVVLLDNGDILQGQPTVYYYNFVDTASRHIVADIHQFMAYDAATIGNHDIETGHAVYDRLRRQTPIPILGANVIDRASGKPYLTPYVIINRGGLRIAVIGLLTPAIPAWLPERLWSGLEFQPMLESAAHWVDHVSRIEHPDFIIGLFHSGRDASSTTAGYLENQSLEIARKIPGFDAILMGHDHQTFCETIAGPDRRPVQVVNPANNANHLGQITLALTPDGEKQTSASLIDISLLQPSPSFLTHFQPQRQAVEKFVGEQISTIAADISTRPSLFGPSAFMTLLHRLQLSISGADISMAAPLTFDGLIKKGPLTISDMFTLYKYENTLCTLQLTGREIKDYLEFSYDLWTTQVTDSQPHIIRFKSSHPSPRDNRLHSPAYNFDSAYGIDYTVDITAPKGKKINISGFTSGRQFELDSVYTVAVNSYRAGGGGNHLTEGAGLTPAQLHQRQIRSTDKDLRFYLMNELRRTPLVIPHVDHNWHFIPADRLQSAHTLDYPLLFSPSSSKTQK